jgi:NADP-dependent 3-hydroxy acid dehydrogenase YdfG
MPLSWLKARRHLLLLTPQANGPTVLEVVCDVTDPRSVGAAVETVQHELGPIEVLVNNAGIMAVAPLLNQSTKHFEEAMDTNFYGTMHTTFAILSGMLERQKGSIVNIASIGGRSQSHTCFHIRRVSFLSLASREAYTPK